jgi:DNA-binding transcriptional MerR regulator
MASNKRVGHDEQVEDRRRTVASLRLRGLTVREIQMALAEVRKFNPKDGTPWGLATIQRDIDALKKRWREDAAANFAEHQAKLNAELNELKRQAWRNEDLANVLKAIEQQRKLLGLDAPTKSLIGGIEGADPILVQTVDHLHGIDITKITDEAQLDALAAAVTTLEQFRAGQGAGGNT